MLNHTTTIKSLRIGLVLLALILIPGLVGADSTSTDPFQATYSVKFENYWHHDSGDPDNSTSSIALPGAAHWSPLIGAAHKPDFKFWEVGQKASSGVEDVAEVGQTAAFDNEIDAEITAGNALDTIGGPPYNKSIPQPLSIGKSVTINSFTVNKTHSAVTLISMVAPSPDWFVGVSALQLLDNEANWIDSLEVELFPYDAGTEIGTGYSTSNPAENPHKNITSIRNVAPFLNKPIGKFRDGSLRCDIHKIFVD